MGVQAEGKGMVRKIARDCCQTALRQAGSRVTDVLPFPALASLPYVHLCRSRRGCFGDYGSDAWSPQGQLVGW